MQVRFPKTVPRVPGTVAKQGSKESKVPRNRVPRQGFQDKVAKKVSKNRFARFLGTGLQARFARPGSQARFARTGSQAPLPRTLFNFPS